MNKIYKVIFCKATQTFVAVSELAKGKSKNNVRTNRAKSIGVFSGQLKMLSVAVLLALSGQAWAICVTDATGKVQCGGGASAVSNSVATGKDAYATNAQALAIGSRAKATGFQAAAFGNDTNAHGAGSIAFGGDDSGGKNTGYDATNDGINPNGAFYRPTLSAGTASNAIGVHAQALADGAVAIGGGARAGKAEATFYGNGDGIKNRTIKTFNPISGVDSTAIGANSKAVSDRSTAIGANAEATGEKALAQGYKANASGLQSIAIGDESISSANRTIAIGHSTQATADEATVLGSEATATEKDSVAIGYSADATADSAVAVGKNAQGAGQFSVAVGLDSNATGSGAVTMGSGSGATADHTVALGNDAKANAAGSTALGRKATAEVVDGVALGSNSIANTDKGEVGSDPLLAGGDKTSSTWKSTHAAVSVGNGTAITRQITSVAAGTNDTDAVNVAQLKAAGFKLTTSKSGGAVGGTTIEKVQNGETVTIDAGNNIKVTQAENKITIEAEDTKVTADGTYVKVTPNETEGAGVDTFAVDVSDKVKNAVTAVETSGLTFAGNSGTTNLEKLGSTVTIKGTNGLISEAKDDEVVVKIDDTTKAKIDNAADKNLSNITNEGKKAITNLVTIENGNNTVASEKVDAATGVKTFKVDVETQELTTNADGTVANNTSDAPVSATSVANAINNAGFKLEATADGGEVSGSAEHKIKTGDKVNLIAGNNVKLTQNDDTIKVEAEDTVVESADTNYVTVTPEETTGAGTDKFKVNVSQKIKDAVTTVETKGLTFTGDSGKTNEEKLGSTVAVNGDTNITTKASGDQIDITLNPDLDVNSVKTKSLNVGDTVKIDNTGINAGDEQIKNVASAGDITDPTNEKNAVNAGDLNTIVTGLTNTGFGITADNFSGSESEAGVKDKVALGETVQYRSSDKSIKTTVKDNEIDFVINPEKVNLAYSANGGVDKKVSLAQGLNFINGTNTTAEIGDNGDVKFNVVTEELTTNPDGTVDPSTSDAPVSATSVVNAINNASHTIAATNTDTDASAIGGEKVMKAGEKLTLEAGKNLNIQKADDKFIISTKKEVKFDKVTTKKVTGLDDGVDASDAVNVSQLKAVQVAADKPITFKADENAGSGLENGSDQKLGSKFEILAGNAAGATSSDNLKTKVEDGKVTISMLDAPTFKGKVSAKGLDAGSEKITNVKAGDISDTSTDAVNGSQLNTVKNDVADNATNITDNATEIAKGLNIGADNGDDDNVKLGETVTYTSTDGTVETTVSNNQIDFKVATTDLVPDDTTGKVTKPTGDDAKKLATAGDVADAINNSFWKTTAKNGVDGGEVTGKADRKVKAGDMVTFDAGKNMKLVQGSDGYVYATKDDVKFDSIEIKNGPTINADGIDMEGDNKITNLADGTETKDAVNKSQLDNALAGLTDTGFGITADNFSGSESEAGVKDKVALGETVQYRSSDKSIKTTVKDNEIDFIINPEKVNLAYSANGGVDKKVSLVQGLNFINGTNTIAEIGDNGDVKFNVVTGDIGADTANPGKVKAKAGDENKVATTGDVADAINNSFHKVTNTNTNTVVSEGTATAKIKAGDTITFEAGKNLVSKLDENGLLQVSTAQEVEFDKVTTKKVTGLDDGVDDSDAVNVKQLKALTAAATTKVATETPDLVEINPVVDANDKSTTYNVNMKTSKLESEPNGQVKAPAKPNSLATAGDIANAINNAGWNTEAGAGTDDGVVEGKTTELVKTGEKVVFDAGKNMKLVQDGQKYTYATKDEVKFTKTTVGNVVADGTTNKITGLEAGDINATSKDAVNGSQLFAVGNSTASALGGASKFDPKTGKVTASLSVGGNQYTTVQDALTSLNTTASAHNTTTAGKNIEVVGTPNGSGGINYEVKTKDEVEFNDVKVGDVVINKDTGINAGDKQITNVAPGKTDKDAVNVSQLKGVASTIGGGSTVNPDGTIKQPEFTLTDGDPNSGDNKVYNNVGDALGGLNTAVNQPLTFKGDEGNTSEQKLGSTFEIVAGNAKDTSVDNLKTKVEDGKVTISMADAPTFKGKVSAKGVDAGGERITNVAPGREPMDAVNVSQLKGVAGNLYKALDGVSKDSKAGIAGSAAFALLGHARDAGDSAVSAGIAFHESEAALAVGVSSWSDNGRWLLKGAVSQDTRSQTTVGASATYNW